MASSYPGGLDNQSTSHVDNVDEIIHAATVNDLADAVNKIEAELGTLPKGSSADVKTRLTNVQPLTGATAATRYVGGTTSGAPVSGTFAVGDYIVTQDGHIWICTVAGTPGTWVQASGGSASPLTTKGDIWGFSTVDARIPVGSNGQVLTADSTQSLGLKWSATGNPNTLHTVASSTATLTIDYSTGTVWDITLTANCTFTLTGTTSGVPDSLTLLLRQDATGARKVTWPGSVTWLSGAAPVLHTAINSVDVVSLFTLDGGTTWFGSQAAPVSEFDYVTASADLTVTATTAATAQSYITGNAVTYDGNTRVKIEFWCAYVSAGSSSCTCTIELYDGSTDLGRIGQITFDTASGGFPYYAAAFQTPSAGSHTYSIRGWASNTAHPGLNSLLGNQAQNSFMRITRA